MRAGEGVIGVAGGHLQKTILGVHLPAVAENWLLLFSRWLSFQLLQGDTHRGTVPVIVPHKSITPSKIRIFLLPRPRLLSMIAFFMGTFKSYSSFHDIGNETRKLVTLGEAPPSFTHPS